MSCASASDDVIGWMTWMDGIAWNVACVYAGSEAYTAAKTGGISHTKDLRDERVVGNALPTVQVVTFPSGVLHEEREAA